MYIFLSFFLSVTSKGAYENAFRSISNKCPDELYDALPIVGQPCNAYPIIYRTDFPKNDYNAHIGDYLNTKSTYAIMVRGTIPHLAEMPLFMTQGKLRVRLSTEPLQFVLKNAEEIEKLRRFHTMIFRDLLELWKNFYTVDRRNRDSSYLIVPINDDSQIDWKLVEQFPEMKRMRAYDYQTQQIKMDGKFKPEDYLGKVVAKWYSKNDNERYIVTKIRNDLTPNSPFCADQESTYADFFQSRYGVKTMNRQQFLIEVKGITRRRNFFINALGKSREIRKDYNEILLVPELCHNYHFPGNLWLKAVLLPTIIHRVYYMLHAENIRCRINNFLMGKDMLLKSYEPLPLIVDTSLKRAYDNDENLIVEKEVCIRESIYIYINIIFISSSFFFFFAID